MIQEIEIKYRIASQEDFQRLKAIFSPAQKKDITIFHQTNFFFDTPAFGLKSKSLSIRLREENKSYVIAVKGPSLDRKTATEALSVRLEYEQDQSTHNAEQMLGGMLSPLDLLKSRFPKDTDEKNKTREHLYHKIIEVTRGQSVSIIGSFLNTRTCLPIEIDGHSLWLELDETRFTRDVTHYEIELEIPSSLSPQTAQDFLKSHFDKNKIQYFPANGKAERFYKIIAKK